MEEKYEDSDLPPLEYGMAYTFKTHVKTQDT